MRLDRPNTPKPLVDVAGQAMLVRVIRQLTQAGVEKVVVVLGFKGDEIERALSKYDFDTTVLFVRNNAWESGVAGSVLAAEPHITSRFLLAMADHVFDDVLVETMADCEAASDLALTLIETRIKTVFALETAVKVRLDGERVSAMGRDEERFDGVDAGLFNLPHTIFEEMAAHMVPDRENELATVLSPIIAQGKMRAVVVPDGIFDDVDTPAALVRSEMRIRRARRVQQVRPVSALLSQPDYRRFDYRAALPSTTEIVIGRGVVRDPSRLQLIPKSAASSPVFVFTDENVAALYGFAFTEQLRGMGYDVHLIVLPEGESAKSLTSYAFWVERVLSLGVDERSRFISLGGGVVCNVCGFVASTIYRGLDLVHLPTTLMAQCDAAISHKQGINGHQGKNLVGAYYSPKLVAVDVETLSTLPERLRRDGMAEVIKHALGQDPACIDLLLSDSGDIGDSDFLETVIQNNIRLKCALVAKDPKELREGMILQYGHTVGHAVEHLTGYRLYHGESVAVGMAVAARVARIMGACDDDLVGLHDALMKKYGLPNRVPASIRASDVLDTLRYSKRYLTEGTRMALLKKPGQLWSVDADFAIPISETVLAEAIEMCKEV
jgi:3-dehydroquinate synthase